jgi:CRISPR-associated protein Cmr2
VWHKAYLAASPWELKVEKAVSFESVPGVALGQWRRDVLDRMREDEPFCLRVLAVADLMKDHAECVDVTVARKGQADDMVRASDPECWLVSTWQQDAPAVARALQTQLYRPAAPAVPLPLPPSYVTVIALDGDEMGKWVSGERTPAFVEQLSGGARDYFAAHVKKSIRELQLTRPASPSYHLQFSEALCNFAVYLARAVVEAFAGQLIFAGGDDVLAMVPAAAALDCAECLRWAFRGDPRLADHHRLRGMFRVHGSQGGFVQLSNPMAEQPAWPLVVPGPRADVSVGVALAHVHSPLQAMVRAARAAEKRAKRPENQDGHGRSAVAVTVLKRSGETIEWGTRWDSGALRLYSNYLQLSSSLETPSATGGAQGRAVLSGRFAYALAEALGPYVPDHGPADLKGFDWSQVCQREFLRILARQSRKGADADASKHAFGSLVTAYVAEHVLSARQLREFVNLFRVAAFVRRGGE